MTGIFGMNNSDFSDNETGNTMTFRDQLRYMLPISLSIIVVALILAYAARSKPLVAVFWRFFVSYIVIESGLFNLWLTLTWQRDKWVRTTDRWVREMKKDVLRRRQRRMEIHLRRKQEDENKKKKESEAGKASGSDLGPLRESNAESFSTRVGSRSLPGQDLMRGDASLTGTSRSRYERGSRMTMSGGNGHAAGGGPEIASAGTPASPAPHGSNDYFGLTVPSEVSPSGGGEGSTRPSHGGPRASSYSGLTTGTHAQTNTTDPRGSSGATMRGGGSDGLRFWEGSLGEMV